MIHVCVWFGSNVFNTRCRHKVGYLMSNLWYKYPTRREMRQIDGGLGVILHLFCIIVQLFAHINKEWI